MDGILKLTVRFKSKDFLLKECEFEITGVHSVHEAMKLIELHLTDVHLTLKISPETRERIRRSMKA